jgi:hypothetical protein
MPFSCRQMDSTQKAFSVQGKTQPEPAVYWILVIDINAITDSLTAIDRVLLQLVQGHILQS